MRATFSLDVSSCNTQTLLLAGGVGAKVIHSCCSRLSPLCVIRFPWRRAQPMPPSLRGDGSGDDVTSTGFFFFHFCFFSASPATCKKCSFNQKCVYFRFKNPFSFLFFFYSTSENFVYQTSPSPLIKRRLPLALRPVTVSKAVTFISKW